MNLINGKPEELNVTLVERRNGSYNVVNILPEDNGEYRYSSCCVDIHSHDISQEEVCCYLGMSFGRYFDAEEFAAGCVDYYGERFWNAGSRHLSREEAKELVDRYLARPVIH